VRELATGPFQVREPVAACPVVPLNRLDLALVPGLGFDARGGRLGRGKGHYDRLLAGFAGMKTGVAFDFQILPEVPREPHDIALNAVVTPTWWLEVK
jgi:5-formyltetrahydrofolate cyclo-ligase